MDALSYLSRQICIILCIAASVGCGFPKPADVAECTTATDCKSPAAPFCVSGTCTGACRIDDDCLGVPDAPLCQASTGICVGCLDGTSCPTDKPVCDAEQHACRGCSADDQCASGVCVEADGTCAEPAQILRVSRLGTDAGDCIQAPCASIAFALQKVTPERSIVRIIGGSVTAPTTITINQSVVIDADGTTTFQIPASGPTFAIQDHVSGVITLEGLSILSNVDGGAAITVGVGSSLRLFNASVGRSVIQVNGALEVRRVKLTQSDVRCSSGTLTVRQSSFDNAGVTATTCQASVSQSRFVVMFRGAAVDAVGGLASIENNVFIVSSEFADLLRVVSNAPGAIIAFNTIVNTATVVQSPVAIICDANVKVTSNIIAYNSTNPLNGESCVAHASLFDLVGVDDATGNRSADPTTFFKDRAAGDFHLSSNSPARGIGEANLVPIDLEGKPRPAPAGSLPDVGAYEAQ